MCFKMFYVTYLKHKIQNCILYVQNKHIIYDKYNAYKTIYVWVYVCI